TYHGNFTAYCDERNERRRLQLKHYLQQQEEIENIQDFIRRNLAGQKTKQAQSKRLALSKLERLGKPDIGGQARSDQPASITTRLPVDSQSGQSLVWLW
ncbi:MAG: hypothetical protein E4G91_07800, partial [Candidatus Zixiibacteriota bacterium]